MKRKKNSIIPLYQRFIHYTRLGYDSLDRESRSEIKAFILRKRNEDGFFSGRDNRSDPYYSLFGNWLAEAVGIPTGNNSRATGDPDKMGWSRADELAVFFLLIMQKKNDSQEYSVLKLLRLTFGGKSQTSLFYRFFLFILISEAWDKRYLYYYPVQMILTFYSPSAGSPCSVHAATLIARHEVSLGVLQQQKMLFSFFEKDKGFKAFQHLCDADLLSTATALFALKTAGADMRIIAPSCLDFIENNYASGAFLAGNGDQSRDLEYTFYGLLALGTLA
ncbi:MAG: hypothetical protein WCY58_02280 [Mariniphaga sp.]|nr:hypothetical protein [Mariniphaga sp.]MDD4227357.1 hypothetical protein [Mariniphaga sp.]